VTMGAVSAMMGSLCATTRLDAFTCICAWRYAYRNTIAVEADVISAKGIRLKE
jgi:hypothetical protein